MWRKSRKQCVTKWKYQSSDRKVKKNSKILELKCTISKTKILLKGFKGRLKQAEGKNISKFQERNIGTVESEKQKEYIMKKSEQSLGV